MFALSQPDIYKAEALLSPVSNDSGGMGGLASQFGGLASLAGVSLGGGNADKTTMGIEVLQSRQFFAQFMTDNDVLVPLMASNNWESSTNRLVIDPEIYDVKTNAWVREAKAPRQSQPSVQEAHEKFKEIIAVSQDKETGFVTLSIEHYSPYVAKKWVDTLIVAINETIREQEVAQAERSISYLKQQIQTTQLAELQVGFFELIQSQTETIMLANASPEYLFKTLDPAVVPELKAKPKRALIAVLGTLLGGMFGVLIVLVRHFTGKAHSAE
jgi:uncharacterized protein involved in exopolysaccharide biosynthesis